MGTWRVLPVFSVCAVLLALHQVSGQIIAPDVLKPELVDPTWSQIDTANILLAVQISSQVRRIFLFGVASYDALAVYSKTRDGFLVGGSLRRPAKERTAANKRLAVAYATYRILVATYGAKAKVPFDNAFAALNLNPNDTSTDPKTGIGMGNIIGNAMIKAYTYDKWNQFGNYTAKYNGRPGADWTGYKPKNTAYELKYPGRWQPLEYTVDEEYSVVQSFSGVHWAEYPTVTGYHPSEFKVPYPAASLNVKSAAYKKQADRILAFSAGLNDTTKMYAEAVDTFFGDRGATFLANKYGWNFEKQILWNFVFTMCVQEASIVYIWWKRYYDTVRPVSVIRMSGLYDTVTAWGGPGKGTVTMKASEFRQYNSGTDASPEYPSGACALANTYVQVATGLLGTEDFGWSPIAPPGVSMVEPGTPKEAVQFSFPKFTDFGKAVIVGRETGGVHFQLGALEGANLGDKVGKALYKKLASLFKTEGF
eukprot:TRINITY_DN2082_c2_g1_i1.p1 TRINITY_DN2082_c2_g1~~TRINITY_DN2082_c2_g1_i1.p1  ORF type:complete len:479 (+),score=77.50 TRINITY_DN2082_c2_g1_i1:65-1501(+)